MDDVDVLDAVDVDSIVEDVDQQDETAVDQDTQTDESAATEPADKIDGRKFNPEWSKALKAIREANPDYADMLTKLRDNYARYQTLQELAPKGLDDVRGWKSTIDALGGPEAAASLMERAAEMDAVDERISAGDFSVISELPQEMQAGFYQMVPQALAQMAESNPQAFEAAVKPHFQSALLGTGLDKHLEQIYGTLGDNDQAKALVKQVYDWFQQQVQGAGALPGGQRTVDPQVKALQEKLSKYEKGDDDKFVSSVTDSAQKHLDTSFSKLADVYVKQLGLTKEQQDDLAHSFNEKLTAKLNADAAFQSQLKAFKAMRNRSPEAVSNYVLSKIDENAKTILDSLVKTRYGAMIKKAAPRTTASVTQPSNNGAIQVGQIPDQSQWDMDRMQAEGYENTAKKGLYYLKGGKSVQVARSA